MLKKKLRLNSPCCHGEQLLIRLEKAETKSRFREALVFVRPVLWRRALMLGEKELSKNCGHALFFFKGFLADVFHVGQCYSKRQIFVNFLVKKECLFSAKCFFVLHRSIFAYSQDPSWPPMESCDKYIDRYPSWDEFPSAYLDPETRGFK